MSHGPQDFRLSNVKRAIRGAQAAGITVGRIKTDKQGTITIEPESAKSNADANDRA